MNLKEIEELGPCTEGWDNLVKHYPKWKGTLLEFMDLDKIPDEDKVWLFADCTIDNDIKKEFAFICAETAMQHTDKKEIHTFHTLNLLDYESGTYDYAALSAADSASSSVVFHDADSASSSVVFYAADYFALSAARSSADYVSLSSSYSAAYYAANSAAEYADDYVTRSAARSAARKDQVDIIKNLLEEKGEK